MTRTMQVGFATLCALALAVALLAAAPLGAAADTEEWEGITNLGVPLSDVTTLGGMVTAAEDGSDGAIWTVSGGNDGATLNEVDPATGEVRFVGRLTGARDSYGVDQGPDGTIYVGGLPNGRLYAHTPGSGEIRDLGVAIPGESYIWRIRVGADGHVYGGTYPNGKVFGYDPATGAFTDYGQMVPGVGYVRSIDEHDGKLYVGTQPEAHLVELDPVTGETREIPFPDHVSTAATVLYDVDVRGDLLFGRISPRGPVGELHVYDLRTGEWVDEIAGANGLEVSPTGPDGRVYLTKDGELHAYDPEALELEATGFVIPDGRITQIRGAGWVALDDPDMPGLSLVGMLWRGEAFQYNPETGASRVIRTGVEGQPVLIRSLAEGPDGRVYVGGTPSNGGIAGVDPVTGARTFNRFGQTEGMTTLGDDLVLGVYPEGRIYRYDPTQPWSSPEYSPVPGVADNPELLFDLEPHEQDRPFAFAEVDGLLAIGTVAKSGVAGGALTINDPASGAIEVLRDLVPDHSVMAIAVRDGIVYGGTSTYGGYGAGSVEGSAHVFAYDPGAGELLWSDVPVAGERTVSQLSFDDDGVLWGISAGVVWAYDVDARELVRAERLADYSWPLDGGYVLAQLQFNAADGHLYGGAPTRGFFRLDRETWEVERLSQRSVGHLVVHSDGDVFFNFGAELFRYSVAGDDGPCPAPDARATVVVRGQDSGVPNRALDDGCTINDRILDEDDWPNHGAFVSHVAAVTRDLQRDGILTGAEAGAIRSAAARSR